MGETKTGNVRSVPLTAELAEVLRDHHRTARTFNNLSRQVAEAIVTRAITGHVTEEMTEHYSHVDRAEKLRAADVAVPNASASGGSGGGLN